MKHVTKLCVTCCLLFLACMPIMAQQQLRLISGIVTDESGEPLTGARIFDITGNFIISLDFEQLLKRIFKMNITL